jgi:hypothetical protein
VDPAEEAAEAAREVAEAEEAEEAQLFLRRGGGNQALVGRRVAVRWNGSPMARSVGGERHVWYVDASIYIYNNSYIIMQCVARNMYTEN